MTVTDYRNFDLLITRSGERYRAFVVDAPGGDANITFDLPFAPGDVGHLGVLTGVRRGAGDKPTAGTETDLTTLGRQLFETIFRDEVGKVLASSLTAVAQEKTGLRLRLRFEEDAADLAGLPWETLYDPALNHFVALGEASPILRYLAMPRSRPALLVEPPLRVLAVLSSPAGLPSLDMDREWGVLQTSLADLVADGKFVVERLERPSLAALQNRLLGEPVHILHFVGHGIFDETSQAGSLVLEDAQGKPQLVRGEQLAIVLRNHPALRLIYLNACEGALASGQSVFTGVAQTLVREGVPAAVAMQAEISDGGAIELARTFYTALAAGRPVDAALTQARVALAAADSQEWAIPVLFSRSPDNRLFDIREVLPTPDCPYPGMRPFTQAQAKQFFGRDQEIDEAISRLAQHPFLTVVGPSGSGKSSLAFAGIIPAITTSHRFGKGEWTVHTVRPTGQQTAGGQADPAAALAEQLGCTPDELPLQAFDQKTLLIVDQFEEVFTLAKEEQAQAFLATLVELIGRPNLYILLTVRADFYPEMMAAGIIWPAVKANRLELTPLGDDELWDAIVQPAAQMGVTVDDALAVALIADASGEAGVLPLVQETLVMLWGRVKNRTLGRKAYQEMAEGGRNGIQIAIDRRANTVYNNLLPTAQPMARRIFLRLIQFGEGRADTRRQQTVADLRAQSDDPTLFNETLGTLTDSRLLTTSGEADGSRRQVDISHEALIGGWGLLQGWSAERKETEIFRRRLELKTKEWQRLGEGIGGLLDAYELAEAEEWTASEEAIDLGFTTSLEHYIEESRTNLEKQRRVQEEAERREQQKETELVTVRRQRVWIMAASAATVAALIAIFVWITYESATMPEETFNIAVADFAVDQERGNGGLEQARDLAINVTEYLQDNVSELESSYDDVTIWGPSQLEAVNAKTVISRSKEINADVIIYAMVTSTTQDRITVVPTFYIDESNLTDEAADIVDSYSFADPLTLIENNAASVLHATAQIEPRLFALLRLLLGLGYLEFGDAIGYSKAIGVFEETVQDDAIWQDSSAGEELFYLFLGTAYLGQSENDPDEDNRQILLRKAEKAYREGLEFNPGFPRLYNALGGTLFQIARPPSEFDDLECKWDDVLLEQAQHAYLRALEELTDAKTGTETVSLRANLGLGRIYLVKAYCQGTLEASRLHQVEFHLQKAVDLYEADPKIYLSREIAVAHQDLGLSSFLKAVLGLHGVEQRDQEAIDEFLDEAAQQYERSVALASGTGSVEGLAQAQITMPYLIVSECLQPDPINIQIYLSNWSADDNRRTQILDEAQELSSVLGLSHLVNWEKCFNE